MTYIEIGSQGANKNIDFGWNRGFINGVCCTQIVANFRGSQSGNYLNNVPDNTEYEVAYTARRHAIQRRRRATRRPSRRTMVATRNRMTEMPTSLYTFERMAVPGRRHRFGIGMTTATTRGMANLARSLRMSTLASRTRLIRLSLAMSAFTMSRSPSPTSRRSTRTRSTRPRRARCPRPT